MAAHNFAGGLPVTTDHALNFDLSACRLEDFDIVQRLGRRTVARGFYGVNSAVYLAKLRAWPEHFYALKICLNLDPSNLETQPLMERFQSEYRIQYSRDDRLPRHENILRILSVFTGDAARAMLPDWEFDAVFAKSVVAVMEVVPTTLAQVITVSRLTTPVAPFFTSQQVLSVANGILAGVLHINQHRIVHRDLKPDNVLVSFDLQIVRIADFGCCLDCKEESLHDFVMPLAARNVPRGGASGFLPPEVLCPIAGPSQFIDYAKSDVFSTGLVLYSMLTANWPFSSTDARNYTPEDYASAPVVYAAAVRELVDGLLVLDPAQRLTARQAALMARAALADEQIVRISAERDVARAQAAAAMTQVATEREATLSHVRCAARVTAAADALARVTVERDAARTERDILAAQVATVTETLARITAERAAAQSQAASAVEAMAQVTAERDVAILQVTRVIAERDTARTERDIARTERDSRMQSPSTPPVGSWHDPQPPTEMRPPVPTPPPPVIPPPVVNIPSRSIPQGAPILLISSAKFSGHNTFCAVTSTKLYVPDESNPRVFVFDKDCTTWTFLGDDELRRPMGCAVFRDRLLVADRGASRISEYPCTGGPRLRTIGSPGSREGEISEPTGLDVWGDRIFVVDASNDRISVFNINGEFDQFMGCAMMPNAAGISASDDYVFAAGSEEFVSVFRMRDLVIHRRIGHRSLSRAWSVCTTRGLLFVTDLNSTSIAVFGVDDGVLVTHLKGFGEGKPKAMALRDDMLFVVTHNKSIFRVPLTWM